MKKILTLMYRPIFIFYVYLVMATVFFERDERRSINLIPLEMIKQQGFTLNVWGNIVLFIPLGVYAAHFLKRSTFLKVTGILFAMSMAIESIQYVLKRGASDVDDVLLNVFGGMVGYSIYAVLRSLLKTKDRLHIAICVLSLIVGIPVMGLTFLLWMSN